MQGGGCGGLWSAQCPAALASRVAMTPAHARSPLPVQTPIPSSEVRSEEIVEAMKLCWERAKLVVEPSSAVALAAARKLPAECEDVGVVLSGGNVDLGKLPF